MWNVKTIHIINYILINEMWFCAVIMKLLTLKYRTLQNVDIVRENNLPAVRLVGLFVLIMRMTSMFLAFLGVRVYQLLEYR